MTFKDLRERAGFRNVSHLAAVSGIEVSTITKIEAGRVADPRYSTIAALADALGMTTAVVAKTIKQTALARVA